MLRIGEVIEFLLDNGENIASVDKRGECISIRLCNTDSFYVTLDNFGRLFVSRRYRNTELMQVCESLEHLKDLHYLPLE